MRFLLVILAPTQQSLSSEAVQKSYQNLSCWYQGIHGLKCVCSAFYEAAPPHWGSWIPSSSCVHDLKREHKEEKKSARCYEKD